MKYMQYKHNLSCNAMSTVMLAHGLFFYGVTDSQTDRETDRELLTLHCKHCWSCTNDGQMRNKVDSGARSPHPKIMQACLHAKMGHEATLTTKASLIFIAADQNLQRARPNTLAMWHIVRAED